MKNLTFKRWHALVVVLLIQTFFSWVWLSAPDAAKAGNYFQSRVQEIQVDPSDGSLWVRWIDQSNAVNGRSYIIHLNSEGQTTGYYSIPNVNFRQAGFVMIPGSPRYYYADVMDLDQSNQAIRGVFYLDLNTGKVVSIPLGSIPTCNPNVFYLSIYHQNLLVYNAPQKHLYIPCGAPSSISPSDGATSALVVDVTNDKITGTLPFVPLAYNPNNSRLYVVRSYNDAILPGFTNAFFDLIIADAKTEKLTADAPLMSKYAPYASIRSLLVNTVSGNVYVVRSFCYAKCSSPEQGVFDGSGKALRDWTGTNINVEYYLLLNEKTNQLYGPRIANLNREIVAMDGANVAGDQLAGFYWTPMAIDQARNKVYAVDNRGLSSAFSYDRGLGILVMDSANYDITGFFTIRPPDFELANNGLRLSGPPANFQGRFFSETGHTLSGKFLDYWNSHGGLEIFGYPITEVFTDYNPDDGKTYQVQYFERNRFEYHPELAGTPFEVQLGLLGRSFSAQTGPAVKGQYSSGQTEPVPGGVRFLETGHTLTGKFLDYWNAHGGLAQFGLPATEPFPEVNPVDGKTYTVQYFERNRFEYHPEFAGSPYEVELGLLGTQTLRSRGWYQFA